MEGARAARLEPVTAMHYFGVKPCELSGHPLLSASFLAFALGAPSAERALSPEETTAVVRALDERPHNSGDFSAGAGGAERRRGPFT